MSKQQTALMMAIAKVSTTDMNPYEILELLQGLLPTDREQIEIAYEHGAIDRGWQDIGRDEKKKADNAEDYFTKTYGNEADRT